MHMGEFQLVARYDDQKIAIGFIVYTIPRIAKEMA